MNSNSFNLTPSLKNKLIKIDELRQEILMTPVSPKTETQLRLEANINHLDGWSNLANQNLSRQQLQELLNQYQAKNVTPLVGKVLSYKNAINYVRDTWSANPAAVTFAAISELSTILDVSLVPRDSAEPILSYLYSSESHPVIQAGLAHLAFYPSRSAYLLAQIYLSKGGYDLHGWLSLEDCWSRNKDSYLKVVQQATDSTNSTDWLEFFCDGIIVQMTTIKTKLAKYSSTIHQSLSKYLNERQKQILELIQQANSPVTNRQVQDKFKVSQITASRDLAKLSLAGLIACNGAGRATAYSKI